MKNANCFTCLHGIFKDKHLSLDDFLIGKIICKNAKSDKFKRIVNQDSLCDWHESMDLGLTDNKGEQA